MPKHDYKCYFPFDKIRPVQETAIEFILDAYENGKKYVILDAGVGCGKSSIGITVARYLEAHCGKTFVPSDISMTEETSGTYVLTTQKILQEQYVNDFGVAKRDLLRSIKSSSNYRCNFYKDQSCAESRRILHKLGNQVKGTPFYTSCKYNCCYAKEKSDFIQSPIGVTNFSYFLAETMYAKQLKARSLLIVDEAHNIEAEVGKFIEVSFSEKFAKEILKCKIPAKLSTQQEVFDWIKNSYKSALSKHIKHVEKLLNQYYASDIPVMSSLANQTSKQYEMLDKHICKVNRFLEIYNEENWVLNIVKPIDGGRGKKKFEFKPVDVAPYCNETLFQYGSNVLMMSATVVDKETFCTTVGLKPADVAYIRIPSPFPVENRPTHFLSVGSMSYDNIDKTLPVMVEAIKMLLQQHKNDKGIIHCVSFKVAQYIMKNVSSDRLLTHNSDDRDAVLKKHIASPEPTILVSPSMMEGVDLADDASRFQILCKVPFPYLGDLVVKKRMTKNKKWYAYQTAKSVVQALGRSIRNENDHATSYILDSDWERFVRTNSYMFPSEFIDALKK